MRDIEAKVRSIEADGLVWGACKISDIKVIALMCASTL